jgi:hypothetical protein
MSKSEERIRQRAYEIWEQEGRPNGNDLKHWLAAFEEIGSAPVKKPRKALSANKDALVAPSKQAVKPKASRASSTPADKQVKAVKAATKKPKSAKA